MEDGFRTVLSNAHYLKYPFKRFLKCQQQLGEKRFSLYASVPHLLIDHHTFSEAEDFSRFLKKEDFTVSALIAANYGYSLFAQAGTNHFEISLGYYQNCVRAAKCLGAHVLCLRPQNGLLHEAHEIQMANCIAMLQKIVDVAQEEQISIALGTALYPESSILHKVTTLQGLLNAVDHPLLGGLLDTHVMSQQNESIKNWTDKIGNKLYHVFLSDGRLGGYRVLGDGIYPIQCYRKSLLEAGYRGEATCFICADKYSKDPESADRINYKRISLMEEGAQWDF